MKKYLSFFKIRFINGLQYRTAAYAGVATQLAWGFMYIMLYNSFAESNIYAMNMTTKEIANYIWLQQAFLALFMTWFLDNDIFRIIGNGDVAYELIRPMDLYNMWFVKNCALRLSKTLLRSVPILFIALFLPEPYRFTMAKSPAYFMLFCISMFMAFIVVVGYCMIVYICCFYTISPMGVRMVFVMTADFLSGGIIPIPLMPEWFTKYLYLSPFGAMQNGPFRIYSGNIPLNNALITIMLQCFWAVILIFIGRGLMKRASKKIVVQGG